MNVFPLFVTISVLYAIPHKMLCKDELRRCIFASAYCLPGASVFSLYCDIGYTNYDIRFIHKAWTKSHQLVFIALIRLYCKILFLDCVVLFKGLYIGFVSDIPFINNSNTI